MSTPGQLAADFLAIALGDNAGAARRAVDYANSYAGDEGPSTAITAADEGAPFVDHDEHGDVAWVQFWSGDLHVKAVGPDGNELETLHITELTAAQRTALGERGAELWTI